MTRILSARQNRNVASTIAVPGLSIISKDGKRSSYLLCLLAMTKCSILINVTTDMSPTGDLLVTLIFLWGGVLLSLLRGPRVLHQHCT